MRIATKLTLLFVGLTLVIALAVGWLAVALSSQAQYATLDGSINSVVASGLDNPNTALSNALYVVQHNNYDLTLDVVDPTGQVTQVNTAGTPLRVKPTLANVRNSRSRVVSQANLAGFVIRSLNIGGGDYLVVAGSTSQIARRNQRLAEEVASASVVIALVGVAVARVVTRRDLQTMEHLVHFARDVARGDEESPVPNAQGGRDLRDLRDALVVMVGALRERIEVEARSAHVMQQFVDDASHELRTPLTVIKGYNELMAGGTMSPEQQERALQRVQREVGRMEELVRDLLLLAQIREAPQHEGEEFDLGAVLGSRIDEFADEHPERSVESEIASGVFVHVRRDYFDRLVENALTNVLRHTPASTALRVTLRRESEGVELIIEDAGPGLPVYGVRPQRFERFDQSRSRETGGSGLGMSIMADIAEVLGGSMTTRHSELGGLALHFHFEIAQRNRSFTPVARASPSATLPTLKPSPASTPISSPTNGEATLT